MEDEEELSDDAIRKICFSLWLVELLEKNKEIFSDNHDLVKQLEVVGKETKETMEELTEEQLNIVLEEYKRQNEDFNKEYGYE